MSLIVYGPFRITKGRAYFDAEGCQLRLHTTRKGVLLKAKGIHKLIKDEFIAGDAFFKRYIKLIEDGKVG